MRIEIKLIIVLAIAFVLGKFFPGTFYILDVHATNHDYWINEIENYGASSFKFYNHTSSGYSEITGAYLAAKTSYENTSMQSNGEEIVRSYLFPAVDNVNIATNGVSISYYVKELFAQGYLYNLTSYVCFSTSASNISASVTTGYSATNAIDHSMGYQVTVKQALENITWGVYGLHNCYAVTSLLSSTGTYPWVNLRFTNATNLNTNIEFIGYDIEALGIYNASLQQYVQNAINNSGLATANSVNQVNSAVQYVQEQMDDINGTLTEDHTYNNNPSTNVPGEQEQEDLEDAEEDLFESLDFSGADVDITIDNRTSSYIWAIVEQLRSMNAKIVLLITSALGLGIIKMILNR